MMITENKLFNKDYMGNIVYVAIILYLLDIIVLGSGNLAKIGGISTRMIFFAVALIGTLPNVIANIKKYITNY